MYRAKPKYIIRSLYFRRSPVPASVVTYGAEEAKKERKKNASSQLS
jgi:hypothetical protein